MAAIDFGFNEGVAQQNNEQNEETRVTDITTGKEVVTDEAGNPIENLHDDNNGGDGNKNNEGGGEEEKQKTSPTGEQEKTTTIEPGTIYEIGDDKYTVDADGNLVDKDNKIFRAANEVADFLKEFEEEPKTNDGIDVNSVIKAVGIQIKDDKNNDVQFENTPEGIASYVNSVVETKRDEYIQAGVNRLLQTYPFVADVINYYNANGGSLEGLGKVQDRTSIQLDETNEAQQISIIKEAWKEFGKHGDVDRYINYLKETGGLVDAAKDDLKALQDFDTTNKTRLEEEARKAQEEEQQRLVEYWSGVKSAIDGRKLGKYTIPENIMTTRDGKNVAATPNDFFNYVYQVNDKGQSRYMIDLAKQSKEQQLNDELLRAYLMFTGKSYDSLVDLAKAEKEVIRLKSVKNAATRRTIKVTKPAAKTNSNEINFGFND